MRLKKRPVDYAVEAVAILAIVATTSIIARSWGELPDLIPRHFDFAGNPDAWGRKSTLLFLPAVSMGLYIMLTVVSRAPHRFNYPWEITEQNAERQYRIALSMIQMLKAEVMMLFCYITWATIRSANLANMGLGSLFLPLVLGIVFTTIFIHVLAAARAR